MMSMEASTLRKRFSDIRPGRHLVAIEDAALPVTTVEVAVLGQQAQGLPLIDEFLLRMLQLGVCEPSDVAGLLGIEISLLEAAIAEQRLLGNVTYSSANGQLSLTPRGIEVARDAETVRPVEIPLPLTFDRVTWSPTDYPAAQLIDRRNAEAEGMILLPAQKKSRISVDDFPISSLNALMKIQKGDARVDVIAVRNVRTRKPKYLPIKLLVFADQSRKDAELVLVVDGDLSANHDEALAKAGGADSLGISVSAERRPPLIDPEALDALATLNVEELLEESAHGPVTRTVSPSAASEASQIRIDRIEMYEHADILMEALRSADRRLLIISPWIQGTVVNTQFIGLLEARLRARVPVQIAYGYAGPKGQSNDEAAISRLANLKRRYSGLFSFTRLQNTHAKILIFDDTWIATSFNWLSFKGSRDREYRMEEGVRISGFVDGVYESYLKTIAEQAVG